MLTLTRSVRDLRTRTSHPAGDAGFTLVELIIVVIVIGLLAAIAVPVFLGIQADARRAAVKSDLANMHIAIVNYQAEHSGDMPEAGWYSPSEYDHSMAGVALSPTTKHLSLDYSVDGTTGKLYKNRWCITGFASGDSRNQYAVTQDGVVRTFDSPDKGPGGWAEGTDCKVTQ